MKSQSMFPYRRNGGKKRGKGGPTPPPPQQHQNRYRGGGDAGRRPGGSAAELLPMLQPATRALAQMLAGNTRPSGQLAHARQVLAQALGLVEDRALDRLPPMHREEFLEQFARLKLTITDAEEAGFWAEDEPGAARAPAAALGLDRLRDVAMRLATSESAPPPPPAPPLAGLALDEPEPPFADDDGDEEIAGPTLSAAAAAGPRGERLRLKIPDGTDGPAPVRARQRLRLAKPIKPAVGPSGD